MTGHTFAFKSWGEALQAIGYGPLPKASMEALVKREGARLKEMITSIQLKGPKSRAALQEFNLMYRLVCPDTFETLQKMALRATPELLLEAGRTEKMAFLTALKLAADAGDQEKLGYARRSLQMAAKALGMDDYEADAPARHQSPGAPAPSTGDQDGLRAAPSGQGGTQEDGGDHLQRQPAQSKAEGPFESVHIYAGKGALCFTADTQRSSEKATVRIEGARANGVRTYDWSKNAKVVLQCSISDMVMLLCVLTGQIPSYEMTGRGERNDKWFKIADQQKNFYVTMGQKDKDSIAVPVNPQDSYQIYSMIIKKMLENDPHMTSTTIMQFVKGVAERYRAATAPDQRRANAA